MRTIPMPLLLGAFLFWCSGEASPQHALPAGPQRVVFVCEQGSVKSLVAMTYFNREGCRIAPLRAELRLYRACRIPCAKVCALPASMFLILFRNA